MVCRRGEGEKRCSLEASIDKTARRDDARPGSSSYSTWSLCWLVRPVCERASDLATSTLKIATGWPGGVQEVTGGSRAEVIDKGLREAEVSVQRGRCAREMRLARKG